MIDAEIVKVESSGGMLKLELRGAERAAPDGSWLGLISLEVRDIAANRRALQVGREVFLELRPGRSRQLVNHDGTPDARARAIAEATPRLADGTAPGNERSPVAEIHGPVRCPADRRPVCWLLVPNLTGRGETVYPHDTGIRIPGVRTPALCAGSFRSRR